MYYLITTLLYVQNLFILMGQTLIDGVLKSPNWTEFLTVGYIINEYSCKALAFGYGLMCEFDDLNLHYVHLIT